VRAGWPNALDASFSKNKTDNRWNTANFKAFYCCCSRQVANAVVEDILNYAGVDRSDLQPDYRPQLVLIGWTGSVVDVVTADGVSTAGLPPTYPDGVDKAQTRKLAEEWFAASADGVVCRSASMQRKGLSNWNGNHENWSEIAIFLDNASTKPVQISRTDP
jgi:RES domain-containing protein